MAYPAPFLVVATGSSTWRWRDPVEEVVGANEDLLPRTPKVLTHSARRTGIDPIVERAAVNMGWEIQRWDRDPLSMVSREINMVLLFCEDCRACDKKIPHLTHETDRVWYKARALGLSTYPVRAPGLRTFVV